MNRIPINSKKISAVGFDNGVMEVELPHGIVYQYQHIPEVVYRMFITSPSPDKCYSRHIYHRYPFTRSE